MMNGHSCYGAASAELGSHLTYSSILLKGKWAAEKVKESYEAIFHARFLVAQEAVAVAMAVGSKTPP